MRWRRLVLILLLTAGVGSVLLWWRGRPEAANQLGGRPFTDLNTALAAWPGWQLHTPPPHPGPYRPLPGESVSASGGMVCRVWDHGAVVEELRLEINPAFDQMVVYLETPGGRRTMAVLKHPR